MRPLWRCRNCGREWPCQPARLRLLTAYRDDRADLVAHLRDLMEEAQHQLGQLNPGRRPDLTERFLAWVTARGRAAQAGGSADAVGRRPEAVRW
jgi:hypothetical protein